MIPYILHVTVIITVCFLFYKLFLQKATFYRLNRWTLLACLAVSFALPFLPAPRGWSWGESYTRAFAGLFQPHSAGKPNPEQAHPDVESPPAQSVASVNPSAGVNSFVLPSPYPSPVNRQTAVNRETGDSRQSTNSHQTALSGQPNQLPATAVTPPAAAIYIKGFRDLGYKDLEPGRLTSLKAMGITPEYVLEFKKIGFDNIPVELLTSLKATGVNAEYVSKMKEKGLDSKDLNKYMRLKREFD